MTKEDLDTLSEILENFKTIQSNFADVVQDICCVEDHFQEVVRNFDYFLLCQSTPKEEVKECQQEKLSDQLSNMAFTEAIVMIMGKIEKISTDFDNRLTRLEQGR